jgi:hypothetical protein
MRGRDRLDAGLRIGDVGGDEDGLAAKSLDLGQGGVGYLGPAHVDERDVGALAGKRQADSLADATSAARDESGLAGQIEHELFLLGSEPSPLVETTAGRLIRLGWSCVKGSAGARVGRG